MSLKSTKTQEPKMTVSSRSPVKGGGIKKKKTKNTPAPAKRSSSGFVCFLLSATARGGEVGNRGGIRGVVGRGRGRIEVKRRVRGGGWVGPLYPEFPRDWLLGAGGKNMSGNLLFIPLEIVNGDCVSGGPPLALCLIERQQVHQSNSGTLITAN